MSDEQQLQSKQKTAKEQAGGSENVPNNATTTTPVATTTTTPTGVPKNLKVHEMRNQDFINRLMAATPPYLYSAPVGNNFFFSDMLRALVQARQNENIRHLQLQQQQHHHHQQQQQQQQQHQQQQQQQQQQAALLARRSRKRLWSTHQRPYFENMRERKELEEKPQLQTQHKVNAPLTGVGEKPLELTNKAYFHLANAYQRKMQLETNKQLEPDKTAVTQETIDTERMEKSNAIENSMQDTPPAASLPPQDLVLPPPPPVWYPPLYPPYVFDPLHFFIDLRVSGHIYDRKKDNVSPLSNNAENQNGVEGETNTNKNSTLMLPNKHRHGSAFTVPTPRANADALNLSANATKYYDLSDSKENNHPLSKHNANYMLQHLPRLYSQFANRDMSTTPHANFINEANDNASNNNNDNLSSMTDNRSDVDGGDSDGHASVDNSIDNVSNRDIDVEIVDSIKYRADIDSSHCSTPDDASITQID